MRKANSHDVLRRAGTDHPWSPRPGGRRGLMG